MKNKQLIPMTVAALKVVRIGEMGAFLDAGTGNTSDDILLHKAQQTAPVSIGDTVNVFLYLDPKKRLTASMRVPKMREGQIARLKIINVTQDGAFVDAGAERGIFMPFAEMRGRPQVGEVVWAKLYRDKSGRLAVTMKVSDEMHRAKEKILDIDAEKIFAYMTAHDGEMPFHDKTPPQTIQAVFKLSKAAFKRAVGHLYSERRIDKTDGGFKIVGNQGNRE